MSRSTLTVLAVAFIPCASMGCGGGASPSSISEAEPKRTASAEAGPRPDAAAEAELKRLEGTWEIASAVIDGTPQPQPRGGTRVIIRGASYAKEALGTTFEKGILKVDPTKKPGALDVSPTEGPERGRTFLCIYELEGDVLRYCFKGRGGFRPEAFTAESGGLELVTLRRAKAKG